MEFLHLTARTLVEWMLYSLIEGTMLALFVWLLLRILPRQNAGTRFALWFSVLLAMVALPLAGGSGGMLKATASQNGFAGHGLVVLPQSWALIIFILWVLLAGVALARVAVGLWQIGRLRRSSEEVDPAILGPEIQRIIGNCLRPVSLRLSDRVQVPTAIGFLKPAIVLPRWFLQEISLTELKHVLLHELAHLRRRDDWTNLAQRIVKAVLFFHPSAWWIEQRLALERELACDDAVLAQAVSPQDYANCLRRVAEKSFLKRQLALAQAMVNRMRQLSLRVAQILAADRTSSTRLWRPAVPVILLAASVCGISAWNAPALVSFQNDAPASVSASTSSPVRLAVQGTVAREVNADLRFTPSQPKLVLTDAALAKPKTAVKAKLRYHPPASRARSVWVQKAARTTPQRGDYVVSEQVFVTVTRAQQTWQVQVWQVRVLLPVNNDPGKTIPRKNI